MIVGCVKTSKVLTVRYVEVKIGPTGRILINDVGQCCDCFIIECRYDANGEEVDLSEQAIPELSQWLS